MNGINLEEGFSQTDVHENLNQEVRQQKNVESRSRDFSNSCNEVFDEVLDVSWEDQIVSKQKAEESNAPVQVKPKIWKCRYNCGKIFTQEKYMNTHVQVMHENVNMVQCKKCSKYLSSESRLKSHMLRHSGIKHLVCLICINKKTSELSCMRHHLTEKHGITGKHPLFRESFYEMSLKEIAIMERSKNGKELETTNHKRKGTNSYQKSATDVNDLKAKILEKSKKFQSDLDCFKEDKVKNLKEDLPVSSDVSNICQVSTKKVEKIVTTENGMKLIKLANGQFKKVTDV